MGSVNSANAGIPEGCEPKACDRNFRARAFALLIFAFVGALFLLSGLTSLIYQVIWTRMLVFVFGSTTFATATVLAVFMGGLALGSFVAGRISDRLKRPFLIYAVLEGVIGIWALLAPSLFDAAIPLYRWSWQCFHQVPIVLSLARFLVAAAILLLPTTCMGATLPLLSRFVTTSLSSVGNKVGTLYAINTLGAVCGAIGGGFFLLPQFGLNTTIAIAAAGNGLLCLLAVPVALKLPLVQNEQPQQEEVADVVESKQKRALIIGALVCFGASGAIAMVYEVAWTRTLLMVIGSSTYAFTIMLSTFLVGIFIGSFVMARFVDRLSQPIAWFAVLECLTCLAGLLAIYLFNYVPYWNLSVNAAFLDNPSAALAVRFALAAAILLPITLCLGAMFPIVVRACTSDLKLVGRSVGTLYSANTLGAIIGAFVAGFIIVPAVGAEKTLIYASIANLILGVALLVYVPAISKPLKIVMSAAACMLLFFTVAQPQIWDRLSIIAAQMERRYLRLTLSSSRLPEYAAWHQRLSDSLNVLMYEDGACATVAVLGDRKEPQRSLLTNGHVDASITDMDISVLVAAYPLIFKGNAKDVAVVGWGSGVTLGTAAAFPTVKEVVGIEIEPAVLRAAKYFDEINLLPQFGNKVRFEPNDGRNYLLTGAGEPFDVIVSEPSNPWQAGVCNLFTREFFAVAKNRLKPGGIFALWLQFGEVSPANIKRVIAALRTEFPHTLPMVATDEGTMVVLSSMEPIKIKFDDLVTLFNQPQQSPLRMQLARAHVSGPEDLLARMLSTSDVIGDWVKDSEINSDDRNKLEYDVGKTYEHQLFLHQNRAALDEVGKSPWSAVDFGSRTPAEKARIMAAVSLYAQKLKYPHHGLLWAQESLHLLPNPDAYREAGLALISLGRYKEAMASFGQALKLDPKFLSALQARGVVKLGIGDESGAREDFARMLKISSGNALARYYMAQTYLPILRKPIPGTEQMFLDAGISSADPVQALRYLEQLPNDAFFRAKHPDVLLLAGVAYAQVGKNAQAKSLLRQFVRLKPKSVQGLRALASVLYAEGRSIEAGVAWESARIQSQEQSGAMVVIAVNSLRAARTSEAIYMLSRALETEPGNLSAIKLLGDLSGQNQSARMVIEKLKEIRN